MVVVSVLYLALLSSHGVSDFWITLNRCLPRSEVKVGVMITKSLCWQFPMGSDVSLHASPTPTPYSLLLNKDKWLACLCLCVRARLCHLMHIDGLLTN